MSQTMQFSHSRVDLFNRCPYHFKLRYIDKLTELDDKDPGSPLTIGNALHYGIEVQDKALMTQYYYDQFPVLTDKVINESIKLDLAYDKVMPILDGINIKHQEYNIDEPEFRGIVDLITENDDGTIDIFDFKYSNNVDNYHDSLQLHIYQYYLEQEGYTVNKLGYIFIPKIFIRQKKNEELSQFRKRLAAEYASKQVQLIEVPKDEMAMVYFVNQMNAIREAINNPNAAYLPNPNGECYQCKYGQDYLELIEKDDEIMALPKNERRQLTVDLKPDFWIYADSYVGKSTFVDTFDDVLFINTDGNTDNTTSPVVSVADTVTKEGRIKNTHYGWEAFKEVVDDLTTEENGFQIVAIDLLEDLYELCRTYVFDKNNIEHESDSGFGKGWDLVKKEFIDTIKRLKSLNYQIVFISKEVRKDITQKSGASYTTFSPNMKEKNANILSGVVDLTIHAEKDGDNRYINLVTDEHTFGGGRFNFKTKTCELKREAFEKALKDAQSDRTAVKKESPAPTEEAQEDALDASQGGETQEPDETAQSATEDMQEGDLFNEVEEEKPKRRRRKA